jgi:hypothetical protein
VLAMAHTLRNRLLLSLGYGAGLRAGEIVRFTGNGNRVHPVAVTLSIQTAPQLIGQLWRRLPWSGGGRETRWS